MAAAALADGELAFQLGLAIDAQGTGGGVFLFGTVLERFLGLYASMNSFSILAAKSSQRKRLVYEWPARAGWKPLL